MSENSQVELEAAAFRRLVHHLQTHTDVQNIDLMILADFCRNCLAKWYFAEAEAKKVVYGMPYDDWKTQFQTKATPEQLTAFEEKRAAKNK